MDNKEYNIRNWHAELATVDTPFKLFGLGFGNRMTVIKSGEQLLLHSPVKYVHSLADEIRAMGEVKCFMSPNAMHYLHISER